MTLNTGLKQVWRVVNAVAWPWHPRPTLGLPHRLLGACWTSTVTRITVPKKSLSKSKRVSSRGPLHSPQNQLQQLVRADIHYIEKQKKEILQLFPQVKSTIKNMFNNLSTNLSAKYRCEEKTLAMGRINHQLVFQCSLSITWPKPVTFNGYGFNKKNAELSAAIKAAEMLYNENLLTKSGHPVTASEEERQQSLREWNLPQEITIPQATMEEGLDILQRYQQEVQPLLEQRSKDKEEANPWALDLGGEEEDTYQSLSYLDERKRGRRPYDLLTGRELHQQQDSEYRSRQLYQLLQKRTYYQADETEGKSPALPMLKYRDDLECALDHKRILIVSGDTGCGKSTQVPQMILDQWIEEGRGSDCNIVVTQPRRISAISLAKRVARERNERVGESVGYHVRLDHRPVQGRGGIMFCTTGLLLQGLHSNPALEGVSHVIVDEVHERSVQTDLLLILLRRILEQHPSLKLILMSASLSIRQLQRYFGGDETALIEVPGTLYPLTRHYLPEALQTLGINPRHHQLQALMEPDSQPMVNSDVVTDVIRAIDQSRPPGAILCFLPGWQDISLVQNRLQEDKTLSQRLSVLPLHSRLPTQEQELIFEAPPQGKRKVVLSTNLAETSLTVNDVVYVIDTGFHKEHRYNSNKGLTVLGNHWISRANSQQRAGRAGRVQPGEVFHLYSSAVHQDMNQFPVPEIMRIPLEHVILQCKARCGEESALSFLSQGINVPSRRFISAAIVTLENLGMLTSDSLHTTECLTPLGQRVTHFSTPPQLSKALVYASIFRCLDSALTISAALTGGRGVFFNSIDMRGKVRTAKEKVDPTSDLLAICDLVQEWQELEFYEDKLQFCNNNALNHRSLKFSEGIKQVYGNHLYEAKLLNSEDIRSFFSSWNINKDNKQLVLGVLVAGVGRLLLLQRGSYAKGILNPDSISIKTEEGQYIDTGSECVLHQPPKDLSLLTQHLLCVHLSRDAVSRRTLARDLSLLQPLTVALFSGGSLVRSVSPEGLPCISVDGKDKFSFQVNERTGQFLVQLRTAVDQAVNHLVKTRGMDSSLPAIDNFCDDLVQYVSSLLMSQEERGR